MIFDRQIVDIINRILQTSVFDGCKLQDVCFTSAIVAMTFQKLQIIYIHSCNVINILSVYKYNVYVHMSIVGCPVSYVLYIPCKQLAR